MAAETTDAGSTGWVTRVLDLMQRQIDDNKNNGAATITALVKSLDERALADRTAIAAALAAQEKAVAAADDNREKQTTKSELAQELRHATVVEKIDLQAERAEVQIKALTSKLDQNSGRWIYIIPVTSLFSGGLVAVIISIMRASGHA